MSPAPSLDDLIQAVVLDAQTDDPLARLAAASAMASELTEVSDALMGHFVDQCRSTGLTWAEISAALRVSKQAAHKRFADLEEPGRRPFTRRTRKAIQKAVEAASSLGHPSAGTEHLLLGMLDEPACLAARILVDNGVTRRPVEYAVLELTPRGSGGRGEPILSAAATGAIDRAHVEAADLDHNYVGTEHLLLAVLHADCPARTVLSRLGAGAADLRSAVLAVFDGSS